MDRIAKFLILLVAALVLAPGCFAEETTAVDANATIEVDANATTEVVAETPVAEVANETAEVVAADFTVDVNTTTLDMAVNQTAAISLVAEDAGIWNITMTEGLEQVGNSTVTNETEEWIIKAIAAGNQTFSAVHEATDAAATEAGESYTLDIVVA